MPQAVEAPHDCSTCERLCASRRAVVNGFGPYGDVWVVGQGPGREEEIKGRPLCGWSGSRVDYLLDLAGIDPESVRRENVTRCRPPRGKGGDLPPKPDEIRNCAAYLLAGLAAHPPKVIVALGAPAAKWFLPDCKIGEDHGRRFTWTHPDSNGTNDSIMVVPMYHPAAAHPSRNPGLSQVMMEDWKRLGELVRKGVVPNEREYIEGMDVEASTIAFDYETTDPTWNGTFQPTRARIIGVSTTTVEEGAAYTFCTEIPSTLRRVLEDPAIEKVAHNALFEYIVSRTHGCTPVNLHDTKLMAYVLRTSTTYLKGLTWTELGIEQTHFDQVDWADPDQVVNYAGADSALTLTLFHRFKAALIAEGLWDLYEIERAVLPVLGEMALHGVAFDARPLKELADDLMDEQPNLINIIRDYFSVSSLPDPLGLDAVNLNSGSQLAALLYGPPTFRPALTRTLNGRLMHSSDCHRKECVAMSCAGGVRTGAQSVLKWLAPGLAWPVKDRTPSGDPATDMNTIRLYEHEDVRGKEVIGDLVKLKSMNRLLANELTKLPLLVHEDGRIHPSFHQSGHWDERGPGKESPLTGRFSSSGPNLQNITHHGDDARPYVVEWAKRIRRGFIASPDMVLLKADIGQEEPRIGAMISGDDALLYELVHGDVYCPVASLAFKKTITPIDREERQIGKRNWMAWLNGAGPSGIQQAAYWLSDREATGVVEFLKHQHPKVEATRAALVAHLYENGFTETWFGRRIYRLEVWSGPGPARNHAERSVMPDRIQGTGADVMKIWMSKVHAPLIASGAHIILTIHDELDLECPPDSVKDVYAILKAGLKAILPIDLPLEVEVGKNWADMIPFTV